jgi:hypothetical protein
MQNDVLQKTNGFAFEKLRFAPIWLPLFWLLNYQTCCLPHGWTRDLKNPLIMGIIAFNGIEGEFLKPISWGVWNCIE